MEQGNDDCRRWTEWRSFGSVIAGGNFWDGMRQGLITSGLNHALHYGVGKMEEMIKVGLRDVKTKGGIVKVQFENTKDGRSSNNKVSLKLRNIFEKTLDQSNQEGDLKSVTVSATTNGEHASNSRHYSGQALDISMVNGLVANSDNPMVSILQGSFEIQSGIRENFGPSLMKKEGQEYIHEGLSRTTYEKRLEVKLNHQTHIHWSIND